MFRGTNVGSKKRPGLWARVLGGLSVTRQAAGRRQRRLLVLSTAPPAVAVALVVVVVVVVAVPLLSLLLPCTRLQRVVDITDRPTVSRNCPPLVSSHSLLPILPIQCIAAGLRAPNRGCALPRRPDTAIPSPPTNSPYHSAVAFLDSRIAASVTPPLFIAHHRRRPHTCTAHYHRPHTSGRIRPPSTQWPTATSPAGGDSEARPTDSRTRGPRI